MQATAFQPITAALRERIAMTDTAKIREVMQYCKEGKSAPHSPRDLSGACLEELSRRGVATMGDMDLYRAAAA